MPAKEKVKAAATAAKNLRAIGHGQQRLLLITEASYFGNLCIDLRLGQSHLWS